MMEENKSEKVKDDSDTSSESDSSDSDSEEEIQAPIELLGEFLKYVRQGNWKDAHKLCKMILIYEPENEIAKKFLNTIAGKSKIEEELAAMSSSSEEDSDSDDESSDSGKESIDADDEDSDKELESSSDEEIEAINTQMKNALVFPYKVGVWKP